MSQAKRKAGRGIPSQPGVTGPCRRGEPRAHESAAQSQDAIDLAHLDHTTLGERRLAREVLQLFDRHAAILLEHIKCSPSGLPVRLTHTLKGSARGIGAWKVAAAAGQYELAAQEADSEKLALNVNELGRAILDARSAIGSLLGGTKIRR
jgi:hypothetical protein